MHNCTCGQPARTQPCKASIAWLMQLYMQLILIWSLFVHFCDGTAAILQLLLLLCHSELGACCRSSRC